MKDYNLTDADVKLFEHFFTENESDSFYKKILEETNWQQEKIKMFGKELNIPRLTAWYGDNDASYSYSGILMKPEPWNDILLSIKEKIELESGTIFNSCLLNFYRDGQDSVSWHQDNEKELGENPIIGSVTFGNPRNFQMRHINDKEQPKINIPLEHSSFLLMAGKTQHYWQHQIPKTKKPIGSRINLTFRNIIQ